MRPGLHHRDFLLLWDLLIEYDNVFLKWDFDLGCFTWIKHHIDTGSAKPIKQHMKHTPFGFQEDEENHLQNLFFQNLSYHTLIIRVSGGTCVCMKKEIAAYDIVWTLINYQSSAAPDHLMLLEEQP